MIDKESSQHDPHLVYLRSDATTDGAQQGKVDYYRLMDLAYQLLKAIGEDPERPGLKDTPRRWASWWREFMEHDAGTVDTAFESVSTDQMVVVKGIEIASLCEHHLLPFTATVTIGYIATGRVLGLSKFARIAQKHAHKLQLQEQLGHQIADELEILTDNPNVAVLIEGPHSCMTIRGVQQRNARMVSSVMRGVFRDDPRARSEFLTMAGYTR